MYELPERFYSPKDFVETVGVMAATFLLMPVVNPVFPSLQNTGNKVNKKTILCGSQQILLSGRVYTRLTLKKEMQCSRPICILSSSPFWSKILSSVLIWRPFALDGTWSYPKEPFSNPHTNRWRKRA
jgi:hypothetical protein